MKTKFLIHYNSSFKRYWDIFIVLVIFYCAITIPYIMASEINNFDIIYWFLSIIFACDIFVNFNTTVRIKQNTLTQRREISKHYLKTWFFIDLLAAIPFAYIFSVYFNKPFPVETTLNLFLTFKLLRILQLVKLFKTRIIFRNLQAVINLNPSIMRLIIFVFWFAIIVHLMSLGWIIIGASEKERPFTDQYIISLYWCVTTIATIGYGDITPDKNIRIQLLYTIFVQLLGVGMYGYIIGNISSLIANIDVAKSNFVEKMEQIKEYMRIKKIPYPIQDKVKNYYNYLWETKKSITGVTFLNEIPPTLKMEISLFLNRTIIDKVSLFKDANDIFIREIVQILEPLIFLPDDYIIRQEEYGECMYFLNSGDIEVLVNGIRVAMLGPGSPFGETALIQGEKRTASIRTLNYCDVYKLSKQDFDILRSKYPDFDNKVNEIMNQRIKDNAAKMNKSKN
ncbi:MAG: hypothetical protein A2015_10160 [Spirochaetes bacterium GWF1_31_7]|nr:MAG: hypothetical protein A2Y30_05795 [Spirochaetes bacterium GWE1_32_154]OHD49500.1 MAG: hypothetical protein A2Y29_01855 [Spirochaetes bacterium GWE2_31_10]OHD49694.1 MAG: hypothetical protein A2015_10160 [Spirochaetes bacterium GWF1_31_7]OHD83296.1 MAG: hypothetical protein A2355_01485 [Spirochaetes bacterium RIFOXYB1_FULL_32_8]HBD96241.1 hypothetical protein [Spirochaetia bacterium]